MPENKISAQHGAQCQTPSGEMRARRFAIPLALTLITFVLPLTYFYKPFCECGNFFDRDIFAEGTTAGSAEFEVELTEQIMKTANDPTIIVITPTKQGIVQLADMTRLSQTLQLVPNIHWIVVEDAVAKNVQMVNLLKRSNMPFTYIAFKTPQKFPGKGWAQRNRVLDYLRSMNARTKFADDCVIYFADDDNSYDVHLFTDYVRKVKKIGVWAVAMAGGALVEAPRVKNGKVIAWDVQYAPNRTFGIDMAGYGYKLGLIRSNTATFHENCMKRHRSIEDCFIGQMNLQKEDLEPFGYDGEKRVMVWHVKTGAGVHTRGGNKGYIV